jgi:serine/threonine protein kinase
MAISEAPAAQTSPNSTDAPAERYPFQRRGTSKVYAIKGTSITVPDRYTITARLGQGSYGMVVQAHDSETGEKVAIKRCASLFKYPEDGKRVLREIKLMQIMNHRNILPLLDVLPPTGRDFEEVCMVLPCLDTDLSHIIRTQTLSDGHCRYIMYQLLRGLKYIHSCHVLHRDLKPANILINFDCRIKICDFGLARGADPTKKQHLTNYVVTRWYRAPELLLDNTRYGAAIDVWASGCIFAEALRGSALFPGESSLDQMHRVADALGVPPDDDLWWVQSAKAREYLKLRSGKENRAPAKDLKNLIPEGTKPAALDFLRHMLAFNPHKRWSAEWLLDHPYLADCHRPDTCTRSLTTFSWEWDSEYPDAATLRKLFWAELAAFHPEIEDLYPIDATEEAEVSPKTHRGTPLIAADEGKASKRPVDVTNIPTVQRFDSRSVLKALI